MDKWLSQYTIDETSFRKVQVKRRNNILSKSIALKDEFKSIYNKSEARPGSEAKLGGRSDRNPLMSSVEKRSTNASTNFETGTLKDTNRSA